MGILLADSGSTKTEWLYSEFPGNFKVSRGNGMNPYFAQDEDINLEIRTHAVETGYRPEKIFFYGAGCANEEKSLKIKTLFTAFFPEAHIEVQHDLLGAARALCGKSEGIACILGTGSNSCHYDGEKIIRDRPALGYILGDEGAGSRMGISVVKAYLYGELPENLKDAFHAKYGLTKDDIVEKTYRGDFPNRFLASFSEFVGEHLKEPAIEKIANSVLAEFVDRHLMTYPGIQNIPVHFTGSVAYHFSQLLMNLVESRGMRMGQILPTPMNGLMNYHLLPG